MMSIYEEIQKITTDWKNIFSRNMEKINDQLDSIDKLISERRHKVYPASGQIFRALNYFNIRDTRVCIIGQDCYHGTYQFIHPQANGLAFSVNDGVKFPPSLKNISKELENSGYNQLTSGNLESWAKQGVLLLNASLTVRHGEPGSHCEYWKEITDGIIKVLARNNEKVIYLLWGKFAQSKKKIIQMVAPNSTIISTSHPSPLGCRSGKTPFIGSKCFKLVNDAIDGDEIVWS